MDPLRAWLEFHRAIDTQPTVLQSRYIMQQNATGFAIPVHRATHTGPGCSCDPLRAELDAGHSMDPLRAVVSV
jgi:hypothetical protein